MNTENNNEKINSVLNVETVFNKDTEDKKETETENVNNVEEVKSNPSIFVEDRKMVNEGVVEYDSSISPNITKSSINAEVLFNPSIEDINVNYAVVKEENLAFQEPVKPVKVEEEVLFKNTEVVNKEVVNNSSNAKNIMDINLLNEFASYEENTNAQEGQAPVYVDKTFPEKMLETETIILDRYNELKNYILRYKKVKSRISNNFDTFNVGRLKLFKMLTTGKALKLYINIKLEDVEPRFKCKYAGDRKSYSDVPTLLKVKSDRGMKNAKYLIDLVCTNNELKIDKNYEMVDAKELLIEYLNNK